MLTNNSSFSYVDIYINLATFLDKCPAVVLSIEVMQWLKLLFEDCAEIVHVRPLVSASYRILRSLMHLLAKYITMDTGLQAPQYGMSTCNGGTCTPAMDIADRDRHDGDDDINAGDETSRSSRGTTVEDIMIEARNIAHEKQAREKTRIKEVSLEDTCDLCRSLIQQLSSQLVKFKDELLTTALTMTLTVPSVIVDDLRLLAPSIQLSLESGYCVDLAVQALDRSICPDESKRSVLRAYLPTFLGLLDNYLMTDENSSEGATMFYKTKARIGAERRRLSQERSSDSDAGLDAGAFGENSLQIKILRFLGRLGGDNQAILLHGSDSQSASVLSAHKTLMADLPMSVRQADARVSRGDNDDNYDNDDVDDVDDKDDDDHHHHHHICLYMLTNMIIVITVMNDVQVLHPGIPAWPCVSTWSSPVCLSCARRGPRHLIGTPGRRRQRACMQ
jgi:hypothetical protein